ncbi:MAG: F0F1 ATP synthase subunit A [Microbacterium sp.]
MEPALINLAATLTPRLASDGEFHGPSIDEFFPETLFTIAGIPVHRITLIQLIATTILVVILVLGTRRMTVVPGRFQSVVEMGLGFARNNIAHEMLGKKDGDRFLPLLATIFFMTLFFNLTGLIPFFNIAGTSIAAVPFVLAVISYVTFIYAGLKKSPAGFLKNSLFPAGVPWPAYIIVTPLEFISTFLVRPVTLMLRLLMNMVVGHMLLVLCFSATWFFFFTVGGGWAFLGIGTLAFSGAFSVFEILVAVLQAYIFTVLTAVYIQLAVADEH